VLSTHSSVGVANPLLFQVGPGCVAWFIVADLFPTYARDAAMVLGIILNWLMNWLVTFFFPILNQQLGSLTFLIFVFTTACFGVFTYRFVPDELRSSQWHRSQSVSALGSEL
jgi:hypothetical protein